MFEVNYENIHFSGPFVSLINRLPNLSAYMKQLSFIYALCRAHARYDVRIRMRISLKMLSYSYFK